MHFPVAPTSAATVRCGEGGGIQWDRNNNVRTVPVSEVCGSPHTANVVRHHGAALVAVERSGKFWEILEGAENSVRHTGGLVVGCW